MEENWCRIAKMEENASSSPSWQLFLGEGTCYCSMEVVAGRVEP